VEPGIELDQGVLIQTLQNKLAQATIREAQLESAVQSLMTENSELKGDVTQVTEDIAEG